MGQSIKQNTDGSAGLAGPGGGDGEFVTLFMQYDQNSVDLPIFVASRRYIIKSVIGRPTVAGNDAGAVTAGVNVSADGTSTGGGNKCHTSTINLKGTAHTNQVMVMNTDGTEIVEAGSAVGVNFSGTLSGAPATIGGTISITLCPA